MKRVLVLAAAVAAATVSAAPAEAAGPGVTVMSRNMYVGSPLLQLVFAPDRAEFERRTAAVWETVRRSDPPARAKAMAREIDRAGADVVGLQEVTTWLRGPAGVKDGPATPARTVVYDYRRLLLRALARRGLRYRAVAATARNDIEAPTALGYDVRLREQDAILVRRRRGLRVRRASARTFADQASVQTQGGQITARRGYAVADLGVKGRRLRVVSTHLESDLPSVRNEQAEQLAARRGPLRGRDALVLLGDLNSDPAASQPVERAAYRTVARAGLRDANRRRLLTCCHAPDLLGPAGFSERIDHVLFGRALRRRGASVTGRRPSERTAGGLWPSDHGGVVARLAWRR